MPTDQDASRKGIPRLINVICDNVLIDAFGDQSAILDQRNVTGVGLSLQFFRAARPAASPVPRERPLAAE